MNTSYNFWIILVILRITIIILWILDIYLVYSPPKYQFLDINTERFWKARISFLFEAGVALLLIYLFNPFYEHAIDKRLKFTLFLVGVLTILRANWVTFIRDSPLIKYLQ